MSGPSGPLNGTNAILYALYTFGSVAGLLLLKARLAPALGALRAGAYVHMDVALLLWGAALYASSFVVWLAILSRLELSVAYPVAISLTLVCSTLGAAFILGETVTIKRLVGIAVVFIGIWLITRR